MRANTSAFSNSEITVVWNELALKSVRYANVTPLLAARQLAVVHLAVCDATCCLNGLTNTYFLKGDQPPENASLEAAVSSAAYHTTRTLFPKSAESLDSHYRAILSVLPNTQAKTNGLNWGKTIAVAALKQRQFDGSGSAASFATNTIPGYWRRTWPNYDKPLLPNWGKMKPFSITNIAGFRPAPPASLDSSEWAAQYNLLKSIGGTNSSIRTLQQREIALFWADGANTETPPGHWNKIAQQLIDRKGLNLLESARLFAALNVAMADASIVCWDAKYTYNFWRPITAIQNGETDNNPATDPDPAWRPLLPTPPFPEHTSGHSTFSMAAATILAHYNGSDEFNFTTLSDGLPGVVRRFKRFSDAAKEAGMSRIYGGIHFPSANEHGLTSGQKVAEYILTHGFSKSPSP